MKRISSSSAEDQPNEKRPRIQQEEEEYDPGRGLLLLKLVLEYVYEILEEEMYLAERNYYKKVNELNDLIHQMYCYDRYNYDFPSAFKVISEEKKDHRRKWDVEKERITKQ